MIIDITGIQLTPGNGGKDCLGNGEHFDDNGELIECCCDECDYEQCCLDMEGYADCGDCEDGRCPHALKIKD